MRSTADLSVATTFIGVDAATDEFAVCVSYHFEPVLDSPRAAHIAHCIEHLFAEAIAATAEPLGGLVSARVNRYRMTISVQGPQEAVASTISLLPALADPSWIEVRALDRVLAEIDIEARASDPVARLAAETLGLGFFPDHPGHDLPVAECLAFVAQRLQLERPAIVYLGPCGLPSLDSSIPVAPRSARIREPWAPGDGVLRSHGCRAGLVIAWPVDALSVQQEMALTCWVRALLRSMSALHPQPVDLRLAQDDAGLLLTLSCRRPSSALLRVVARQLEAGPDREAIWAEFERLSLEFRLARRCALARASMIVDALERSGDPGRTEECAHFVEDVVAGRAGPLAPFEVALAGGRAAIGSEEEIGDAQVVALLGQVQAMPLHVGVGIFRGGLAADRASLRSKSPCLPFLVRERQHHSAVEAVAFAHLFVPHPLSCIGGNVDSPLLRLPFARATRVYGTGYAGVVIVVASERFEDALQTLGSLRKGTGAAEGPAHMVVALAFQQDRGFMDDEMVAPSKAQLRGLVETILHTLRGHGSSSGFVCEHAPHGLSIVAAPEANHEFALRLVRETLSHRSGIVQALSHDYSSGRAVGVSATTEPVLAGLRFTIVGRGAAAATDCAAGAETLVRAACEVLLDNPIAWKRANSLVLGALRRERASVAHRSRELALGALRASLAGTPA